MTTYNPDELRLCYVDRNNFAWFTSAPLETQWGDDWNDAPYEHNAGDPYNDCTVGKRRVEHILIKVAWDSEHEVPCSDHSNSPYSVEAINRGAVPWLRWPVWKSIEGADVAAGCSLRDFSKIIEKCGGEIYLPRSANIYL